MVSKAAELAEFASNTGSSSLYVDDNGNLSLGIASTASKAHFEVDTGYTFGDAYDSKIVSIGQGTQGLSFGYDDTNGAVVQSLNPGTAWEDLSFGGNNIIMKIWGTEYLRINSSGILVLSQNATASFPANSINAFNNNYMYVTGGSGGIVIKDSSAAGSRVQVNSSTMQFETNGAEAVRIDSNGHVYIGATSGTYPLEVTHPNGNGIAYKCSTNSVTNFVGALNSVGLLGTLTVHPVALWTGNSERLRIDVDGRLSLNSTSTTSRAHFQVDTGYSTGNFTDTKNVTIGQGTAALGFAFDTTNGGLMQSINPGVSWYPLTLSASVHKFMVLGAEQTRILSNGVQVWGGTTEGASDTVSINPAGYIWSRRSGVTGYYDRLSTDGKILEFRKDGSIVGNIGTIGGFMLAGSDDTALLFDATEDSIKPRNTSTAPRDAAIDLGGSGDRFKDLYLSGGIYLGGTSSSNHLDHYEEGDWSPTVTGMSTSSARARYFKVGNKVTICATISVSSSTGTSNVRVTNLPFAPNILNGDAEWHGACMFTSVNFINTYQTLCAYLYTGGSYVEFYGTIDNGTWDAVGNNELGAGDSFQFTITYNV